MRKLRLIVFTLLLALPSFGAQAAPPLVGGCQVFPSDNPWNTDISGAAVHPNSANYIANILANGGDFVHPDFGENPDYGIPWITVPGTQPKVPVTFEYDDESDPGPYPIPPNAPVEGGGDRHVIAIDTDNCVLYEIYASTYVGGAQNAWTAGSGAIFSLDTNALRPDGWTSADAAGLPIFPGLARCDEAESGVINHALRFTVNRTQKAYIYPARHFASNQTGLNYPPMGLRLRLKASYDTSGLTGQAAAIATALKTYGMILADNGSNWYISGETNPSCWNDDELNDLKAIPGSAFEVIVSPPEAPVNVPAPTLYLPLDAGAVTSTQPVLGWNTVTSATGYEVQFGRDAGALETVAAVSSTEYTQWIPDEPLVQGFNYFWRVRAQHPYSGGTTDWSATRGFVVASPVNAAPLRNFLTTQPITLGWGRVSWAAQYRVQVSQTASFATFVVNQVVNADTLQVSPTLGNGEYFWRVQAIPEVGSAGPWSAVERIFIDAP